MSTQTDGHGAYQLRVPGSVTAVCVSAQNYQPKIVPVSVTSGAAQTLNVALDPLPTTNATLYGVVDAITAQAGHIPGATIYAQTYYANPQIMAPIHLYTAVTGADGHYTLALPLGSYQVYAAKDVLQSATVTLTSPRIPRRILYWNRRRYRRSEWGKKGFFPSSPAV